jgi:hypothetical protein
VYEAVRVKPESTHWSELKQDKYVVRLEASKETYRTDEPIKVWSTLAYNGYKPFKLIYHAASIFHMNVYGVDHDYYSDIHMKMPRITTVLYRNVSHTDEFNVINKLKLSPGKYRIETVADFSTKGEGLNRQVTIPTQLIIEITE